MAAGIASLVTVAVACSSGSTVTTQTTAVSSMPPVTAASTTTDAATTSSPVEVTYIPVPGSRPMIVHASIDDATLAGFGIGPSDADSQRIWLEQRWGLVTADSGWIPIPESFQCHLYAESRTIWWGDIALSFGRHQVYSPDDGRDYLEGWSVGVADGFTVPLLGNPTAPQVRVLLNGEVEIGSSTADLTRFVREGGYTYMEGFVFGHSYFPVSVNIQDGRVVGFGVSPFECYDDTSGF